MTDATRPYENSATQGERLAVLKNDRAPGPPIPARGQTYLSKAQQELGWKATHSNASMVVESYDWFLAHRDELAGMQGSHHQSPARLGVLRVLKALP